MYGQYLLSNAFINIHFAWMKPYPKKAKEQILLESTCFAWFC